jgi:hypothetical protein
MFAPTVSAALRASAATDPTLIVPLVLRYLRPVDARDDAASRSELPEHIGYWRGNQKCGTSITIFKMAGAQFGRTVAGTRERPSLSWRSADYLLCQNVDSLLTGSPSYFRVRCQENG